MRRRAHRGTFANGRLPMRASSPTSGKCCRPVLHSPKRKKIEMAMEHRGANRNLGTNNKNTNAQNRKNRMYIFPDRTPQILNPGQIDQRKRQQGSIDDSARNKIWISSRGIKTLVKIIRK